MNLPKTFKCKFVNMDKKYYGTVANDKVAVDWEDNRDLPIEYSLGYFKQMVTSGLWEILNDNPIGNYESIGTKIGQLVDKKNMQYGDSFNKSGQILEILYPNGVQPTDYRELLAVTRVIDKLMRIANGNQGEENAWNDIGGYSILMSGGNENE